MSETKQLAGRDDWRVAEPRRYLITKNTLNGKHVRAQSLYVWESDVYSAKRWEQEDKNGKPLDKPVYNPKYIAADLFIATVVDEDGDECFAERDREWLAELDSGAIGPLFREIAAHVNAGPTTEQEAEEQQAELKKS